MTPTSKSGCSRSSSLPEEANSAGVALSTGGRQREGERQPGLVGPTIEAGGIPKPAQPEPRSALKSEWPENAPRIVFVAQNFAMNWSMLWKDLLLGFLIAGALSVFVSSSVFGSRIAP